MAEDSKPGSFDPLSKEPYRRRVSEQKLQSLADSALLKVLQYIMTAVFVPLSFWALNAVLTRLQSVEDAVNKNNLATATVELRLQALERAQNERDTTLRLLTEKTLGNEYEIRALKTLPRK